MNHSSKDLVGIEEMLLRRFNPMYCRSPKNQGKPLATSFFKPRPSDIDGLSVSRASITPINIACKAASGKDQAVARFSVRFIRSLKLTVLPKPIVNIDLGHAVIPELNYSRMESSKAEENAVIELATAIAEASEVAWLPPTGN